MAEPSKKKVKLELSDPSEPLSQKDVIAFQKEALFRCLNSYRAKANDLSEQIVILSRKIENANTIVSNVCASIVVLLKAIQDTTKDNDDKNLIENILDEEETQVAQRISAESTRLCIIISKALGSDMEPEQLSRLQELESQIIKFKNMYQLSLEQLDTTKNYYENLLKKYDRLESTTVSRVFNKKEDESSRNIDKAPPLNEESKIIQPNGRQDDNNTESVISQHKYEIDISDLENQIKVLETTVQELQSFKVQDEKEIANLRQKIASLPTSSIESDKSSFEEKLKNITKENEELQGTNEAFLTKFQQLSSEKEIFNNKLSSEFHTAQEALKKHNASLEKDLVRIRTARDELLSKLSLLESEKNKFEMLDDLEKSLKLQQEHLVRVEARELSTQSEDALLKELQELEKAFRELAQTTNKKYMSYINQESIISKLNVEKTKASEKYFAAMRSKDAIMIENKNLSKNLSKANELVVQLKDLEKTMQLKIESLQKQLSLSHENEIRLKNANKETSIKIVELTSQNNKLLKSQRGIEEENKKLLDSLTSIEHTSKDKELEAKQLKVKLSNSEAKAKKLYHALISNGGDNSAMAEELENFRTIIYCSLCSKNWKNTAIKTCGHVFCDTCCKERLAARMRKCPTCNKPFSSNDILNIHL